MNTKLLATMTAKEFAETLAEALDAGGYEITKKKRTEAQAEDSSDENLDFSDPTRYGCGLRAIQQRYGVSSLTATRMKAGVLAPAIYQYVRGGRFWIDYQKADELLREKNWQKKGTKKAPETSRP